MNEIKKRLDKLTSFGLALQMISQHPEQHKDEIANIGKIIVELVEHLETEIELLYGL